VLPTASVGKLLLLLETERRLADGRLEPTTSLRRAPEDSVADSGLWQHLRTEALPLEDVALLVASVSDNLATNVLLRHVGLDAVAEVGPSLGLATLRLNDRVRDVPTADDPPTLSEGCTLDLARFAALLATEDPRWAVSRAGWPRASTSRWCPATSGSTRSPTSRRTAGSGCSARPAPTQACVPTSGSSPPAARSRRTPWSPPGRRRPGPGARRRARRDARGRPPHRGEG
jgi:hypothetical protein